MASITKRGEGYRVRWRDPDGRARSRQAPTLRVAKTLQREVEECGALGRRWEPAGTRTRPELEQVAGAWLRDLARTVQPATLEAYGSRLDNLIAFLRATQAKGPPTLDDLTREHLAEGWAWLRAGGRTVRTCNVAVKTWKRFWDWAFESDEFGELCPRPRSITLPKIVEEAVPSASWGEVDAMLNALHTVARRRARGRVDWIGRATVVARYTGARISACAALDRADIDLERDRIHFRAEKVKGGRGRWVPLHPALRDAFATWGTADGPICGTPDIQNPRSRIAKSTRRAWRQTTARPEIYAQRPNHCIRRTWRTQLVVAGTPTHVVDLLLGHKPPGTGDRVYTDAEYLWPDLVAAVGRVPEWRPR